MQNFVNRSRPAGVALETTLLLHGVPREQARPLATQLAREVAQAGGTPLLVAIHDGRPVVGLNDAELDEMLAAPNVPKANTANLGILLHRGGHAATTVSTTMELAVHAGVRVFATGGLGGVHHGAAQHMDISSDLAAFTRFPVAVVTAGVKSILNVEGTREVLETLGIPVVGFQTDSFPSFYRRTSGAGVDARFDDMQDLARFVKGELARTSRGVVVCNPIPPGDEIAQADWERWLAAATQAAAEAGVSGRGITPFVLGALHAISGGVTLRANLALAMANARVAGALARAMSAT